MPLPIGLNLPLRVVEIDEIEPPLRAGAFEPLFGRELISILELNTFVCHWPIDDADGGFAGYCGASCAGGPYCRAHAALAYRPAATFVRPPGPAPKPGARPFGSSIILEDEAEAA